MRPAVESAQLLKRPIRTSCVGPAGGGSRVSEIRASKRPNDLGGVS
ncbi:hypothetical protein FTUN_6543 [Frigoriglobus tundricola]|uniref:Uncharacterized protein n=1 Tax=Frigoriglobus tundricola TaxID=2774151 RepID=A0A6M5YYL7_9BACT|nr:hypothetical protein FTUN_6543 [Frigoriglobus tundricola]